MNYRKLIILFWSIEFLLLISLLIGFYISAFGYGTGLAIGFIPLNILTIIPFFLGVKKLKAGISSKASIFFLFGIYFLINTIVLILTISDLVLKLVR